MNILLGVIGPWWGMLWLIIFAILLVILCVKIAKFFDQSKTMWAVLGLTPYLLFAVLPNLVLLEKLGVLSHSTASNVHFLLGISSIVAFIFVVWKLKPWKIVSKIVSKPLEKFKQCPYCNGIISTEAKKCKHCSEWLDGRQINT